MTKYTIDGKVFVKESDIRDYATSYGTNAKGRDGKGAKHDFRLVAGAYQLPLIQLIELFERTGHTVEIDE